MPRPCLLPLLVLFLVHPALSQTLRLQESSTGEAKFEAGVGEVVEVEVRADLGQYAASGLSFYISLPRGPFRILDHGRSDDPGVQPFLTGPLFEGAIEALNYVAPGEDMPGFLPGQQILAYSLVVGPGRMRGRTGSGVVARFHLLCTETVESSSLRIDSSPVHETFLVLADGTGEKLFTAVGGMQLKVSWPTLVQPATWGRIKAAYGD